METKFTEFKSQMRWIVSNVAYSVIKKFEYAPKESFNIHRI
jgi:hypothetical protein